ncbi:MAG: hypothetical protein WD039_01965 [Xanthobacteraceae bacterium]
MQDIEPDDDWKPKVGRRLMDADARVDSFMYQAGVLAREAFERYSAFMDRFHAAGWKRLLVEFTSEGATLGLRRV